MRLKIVQVGEPVLRQRARPLLQEEIALPETQQLIAWMHETVRDAPGVGLAAPQVGLPVQLAVIEDRPEYSKDISAERLADWCGVYVYDGDRKLVPVAIAHRDPDRVRFVRHYLRRYGTRGGDAASTVAATGEPFLMNEIVPEMFVMFQVPDCAA